MDDRWRIVTGILTTPRGVIKNRRPKLIIGVGVSASHALINHVVKRTLCFPADTHANFNKDRHNTRILAERPVTEGTHSRID